MNGTRCGRIARRETCMCMYCSLQLDLVVTSVIANFKDARSVHCVTPLTPSASFVPRWRMPCQCTVVPRLGMRLVTCTTYHNSEHRQQRSARPTYEFVAPTSFQHWARISLVEDLAKWLEVSIRSDLAAVTNVLIWQSRSSLRDPQTRSPNTHE